jgi:hypothetical protein
MDLVGDGQDHRVSGLESLERGLHIVVTLVPSSAKIQRLLVVQGFPPSLYTQQLAQQLCYVAD